MKIIKNNIYSKGIDPDKEYFLSYSDRDWQEDSNHENGNYINKCIYCEQDFLGHKRRVVCRKCQLNSPIDLP